MQGVIINGCIRDSEDIAKMPLGVKALGTYPLKSSKRDAGLSDVPVTIAGVTVHPGDWVYADKGMYDVKHTLQKLRVSCWFQESRGDATPCLWA